MSAVNVEAFGVVLQRWALKKGKNDGAFSLKKQFKKRRFLKGKPKESYRPGWRFPFIVEKKIQEWMLHPCLHICSGQSALGDVRLDLHERSDVKADMRKLPFRPRSFASAIWDPPYTAPRIITLQTIAQLRDCLKTGGRLISIHYFDPGNYMQRTMRLLYKAYYEPKEIGGVRVLTVLERLRGHRPLVGRINRLIEVPIHFWENQPFDRAPTQAPPQPRQISE